MDEVYRKEMIDNLDKSAEQDMLSSRTIYLFGHCEATLSLADALEERGLFPKAILDNSSAKHGLFYKSIPVQTPVSILEEDPSNTIVLIVTRFYEAMHAQLQKLGFRGQIRKLVDFNTFAEYSLSAHTFQSKRERCAVGVKKLIDMENQYPGTFFVLCPFPALGDIYFCMSYLPYFMERRGIDKVVICVSSMACAKVAALFGKAALVMPQNELEAVIQAVFTLHYENAFVAHQDRPYVVKLHCALHIKRFSLEEIYRIGVFGLDDSIKPLKPVAWKEFTGIHEIVENQSVILSPYAKSVTALPKRLWEEIVDDLSGKGYHLFTNTTGNEKPLPGTKAISPEISELKSVVERAGLFIGIRSGLCDVIRTADCRKIALYPDYNYCDTDWKSIDMYALDEFENIVVGEEYQWQMN